MKKRKTSTEFKWTTNSRVYNLLLIEKNYNDLGLCPYCPPHGGCNYWNSRKPERNWKRYRKTQYKQ